MKRTPLGSLILMCVVAAGLVAQPAAKLPVPGAEQKKLAAWVGTWTYVGEATANTFGPAGKISGADVYEMLPGGFFLQHRWDEKNPLGNARGVELWGYDPVKKAYTYNYYSSLGEMGSGTFTVAGDKWHFAGSGVTYEGKPAHGQCDATFAGATSVTFKCQSSPDGKSWIPSFDGKWTKVR